MSEVVKKHYNENVLREKERLSNPYSNIEFQTTIHMIKKYFKKEGHILDIGCGPGRYSIELLKNGYEVTLYDISKEELKIARLDIEKLNMKANDYVCGDGTDLHRFSDNSFDGILLMGPMYHVHDKYIREDILKNVKRILKEDGLALIAYLNGFGVVKSSIHEYSEGFLNYKDILELLSKNIWSKEESFTETYLSNPDESKKEIESSGFEIVTYFGAEGFASGIHTDIIKMSNEENECYKNLVRLCKETCEMKEYRDSTEHTHFIVK